MFAQLYKLLIIVAVIGVGMVSNLPLVEAQANPQINYQGRLNDSTGTAVSDGGIDMEFSLYTQASGGSPIWTENLSGGNQVIVTDGLFSVMLGSTTPLTGVDFDQTLYLGVTIDTDTEMTPRKILGAVPYAFVSGNANALGGLAVDSFLRSDATTTSQATSSDTLFSIIQNGAGNILELFSGATNLFTVTNSGRIKMGPGNDVEGANVVTSHTSVLGSGSFRYGSLNQFDISGFLAANFSGTANIFNLTNATNTSVFTGHNTRMDIDGGSYGHIVGNDISINLSGNPSVSQTIRGQQVQIASMYDGTMVGDVSGVDIQFGGGAGDSFGQVRGINIETWFDGGTADSIYGVYIGDLVGAAIADRYGIYQSHIDVKNYFAGSVGIGTTTPSYKLTVAGTAAFTGLANDSTGYYACVNVASGELSTSTTACGASSERFKENVKNLSYGIDTINALRPVSFDWRDDYLQNGTPQIGFIAEEVASTVPEVVGRDGDGRVTNVDYPKLTAVLTAGFQELYNRFTNLAKTVSKFAERFITRELCLADEDGNKTCITKSELDLLLQGHRGIISTETNHDQPQSDQAEKDGGIEDSEVVKENNDEDKDGGGVSDTLGGADLNPEEIEQAESTPDEVEIIQAAEEEAEVPNGEAQNAPLDATASEPVKEDTPGNGDDSE